MICLHPIRIIFENHNNKTNIKWIEIISERNVSEKSKMKYCFGFWWVVIGAAAGGALQIVKFIYLCA